MRRARPRAIFAHAHPRRFHSTLPRRGDRRLSSLVLVPRRGLRGASLAIHVLVANLGIAALPGTVRPGDNARGRPRSRLPASGWAGGANRPLAVRRDCVR
jgi:hypothetical protein